MAMNVNKTKRGRTVKSVILATRVEPELGAKFRTSAKREGRRSSALLYRIVADYLKKHAVA